MSNKEEILNFLKENLKVEVHISRDYSTIYNVLTIVKIDNQVISDVTTKFETNS